MELKDYSGFKNLFAIIFGLKNHGHSEALNIFKQCILWGVVLNINLQMLSLTYIKTCSFKR